MPQAYAEFRAGWPVLLAGAIGVAVSGVHFPVVGAMIRPLHAAYGWGRGDIALALTIATLVMSIAHVPVGILLDRVGPRPVLIPGSITFALGTALLGLAGPALWTWYAAYALFSLMLVPATAFVWLNAVARQFQRQRGLAIAITLSLAGVLSAVMPMIVLNLTDRHGVRGAYFVLALGALATTLPFALTCIPRQMGGGAALPPALDRAERRALLRESRFWRVAVAVALMAACIGVYSVHFQPMLTDGGLTPAAAARTAVLMAPTFVLGALFSGSLFDRFDPRFVAAGFFLAPALASLLFQGFHGGAGHAALLAVMVGVALGPPVNVLTYVGSYYFPVRHFGFVLAVLYAILGIAISLGSWLAGRLFDAGGSYRLVHVLVIACSVIASLLLASLRGAPGDAAP
jgi:MFS family permease